MILTRKDLKAYIAADALACGRCEHLKVRLPKNHVIPSQCAHWHGNPLDFRTFSFDDR